MKLSTAQIIGRLFRNFKANKCSEEHLNKELNKVGFEYKDRYDTGTKCLWPKGTR